MVEHDRQLILQVPRRVLKDPEALRGLLLELMEWKNMAALDEALHGTGSFAQAIEPFMTHMHPEVPFLAACYAQHRARAIALRCSGGRGCHHAKHPIGWRSKKARLAREASPPASVEAVVSAELAGSSRGFKEVSDTTRNAAVWTGNDSANVLKYCSHLS